MRTLRTGWLPRRGLLLLHLQLMWMPATLSRRSSIITTAASFPGERKGVRCSVRSSDTGFGEGPLPKNPTRPHVRGRD